MDGKDVSHLDPTCLGSIDRSHVSTRERRNGRCANNDRFEAKTPRAKTQGDYV